MSLAVTKTMKGKLDRLQDAIDAETLTETLRRAVAVYEELIEFKNEGGRVILEDCDGNQEVLRLVY